MDDIRSYLVRLTAAALICGITSALGKKKGITGAMVKILTGIFMVLTVFGPLLTVSTDGIWALVPDIEGYAQSAAEDGKIAAQDAWIQGIKEASESYILNKAEAYDARLEVEVYVEAAEPPVLSGVRLRGSISPYGKRMLSSAIFQDLGIPEEAQQWSG